MTKNGADYGSLTTPDPLSLHASLDALAGAGVTHLAMEASSHGLDQRRLDGVRLKAGAFLNLGRDHLDYHPSVEDYLAAAGRKFVARFDAARYLSLSESIDLHRIDAAAVRVPCDIVAVSSDRLVPASDLRALAESVGATAHYHEIDSRYGHDAFLKETGAIAALVATAVMAD